MLFLQIPLLTVLLLAAGDNEDAFQEEISFKMIHSSSFYNHSWVKIRYSAWLGDLQTHGWDTNSGRIIFLRPWSKGNLGKEEIKELEEFFRAFSIEMPHELHRHASEWKFKYPFEIQIRMGCGLHPGGAIVDFYGFAYQGSELLHFRNNSWWPSPKGGTRAQDMCRRFNQYLVVKNVVQRILSDTCPRFLLSIPEAGKADLQREVKPEAWLSTDSNPGPDRQMLVCHVSGFHPKPIWVKWMRGEQVQQGTQQSGILPNADGTWYLQVFLDVEATETSGLYCQVRHSSLGGQDILLYLEHHQGSVGWIILAVMVPLVLLTCLAFWLRKRWSHCEPPASLLPLE
ncbi:T-cell surface glycoprotein CD1a-like [Myotis yumanensis]|uniref:T-cell surface glycoprotein CD1a-like n=1 Tax=Myotis yumanensis TaxID=159337 RepID=UPI0038D1693A